MAFLLVSGVEILHLGRDESDNQSQSSSSQVEGLHLLSRSACARDLLAMNGESLEGVDAYQLI